MTRYSLILRITATFPIYCCFASLPPDLTSPHIGRLSGRPALYTQPFQHTLSIMTVCNSLMFSSSVSCSRLSTYVHFCRPRFACPSAGCHRTSLLATSPSCLTQCPASRILLCCTLVDTGGNSPYSCMLATCCFHETLRAIRSILHY